MRNRYSALKKPGIVEASSAVRPLPPGVVPAGETPREDVILQQALLLLLLLRLLLLRMLLLQPLVIVLHGGRSIIASWQ